MAITDLPDDERQPTQFTLRTLLALQAVCAAFFGLLMAVGVWAVLAAFVATIVYALIAVATPHRPVKRLLIDVMGGLVLPVCCLYYDPGILRGESLFAIRLDSERCVFYSLMIAVQGAALIAWLVVGRFLQPASGLSAGILWVGCLFAAFLGIILLPLSAVGTLLARGIGLLGLTPLLTAVVFAQNAVEANRLARDSGSAWQRWFLPWLGVALALALPLLLYWTVGPQWEHLFERLPHGTFTISP